MGIVHQRQRQRYENHHSATLYLVGSLRLLKQLHSLHNIDYVTAITHELNVVELNAHYT
jgi:hypothetical protein